MTLDAVKKSASALERYAIQVISMIAAQGALRTDLDATELARLTTAFTDPAKANAFLTEMPKNPGAKAILAAFDNPAELAALVDGTLGGDMRALGLVAAKGCGGDVGKLKDFATTFAGNADFQVVMDKGGMTKRPEALAALLQGCGGTASELAKVVDKFKAPGDAAKLEKALGAGGLAQCPDALGALVTGDDGATLKKLADGFTTDDDLTRLNTMLTEGGLDGSASGRPGLLADVIRTGLDDDPTRLKELYDGFHTDPGVAPAVSHLDQFEHMITAFDGEDGKAGERLKSTLEGFVFRDGCSTADAAKRLQDPFMTKLEQMARSNGTPDVTAGAADRSADAAAAGAPRAPDAIGGAMTTLLAAGGPGATLDQGQIALMLGPDAAALALSSTGLENRAAALEKTPAAGDADDEYSAQTEVLTGELSTATDALLKAATGVEITAIKALEAQADALMTRAGSEPDDDKRSAAIVAVRAAGQAIDTALARLSSHALSQTAEAGSAAVGIAETLALRSGASDAEKAVLNELAAAAMDGAVAAAAASGTPAETAAAAKAQVDLLDAGERGAETDRRNAAATAAAAAANEAATEILRAAPPVDPALVARVAALAAAAAAAGQAAPGEPQAKAAFDAAKEASKASAKAAQRAAAASKVAAAYDNPAAAEALAAGGDCDQTHANLVAAGMDAEAVNVAEVAAAARRSGMALLEVERILTDPAAASKAARDAALQGAPDTDGLGVVITAREKDASDAGDAAKLAQEVLNVASATDANYKDLIDDAEAKAQVALGLAVMVVDEALRKRVVTQATFALKEVHAAAGKYADEQLDGANAALATEQGNQSTLTSASRQTLIDDYVGVGATNSMDGSALSAQTEELRAAMCKTANGLLAQELLDSADATEKRNAAAKAQALAAAPGASKLAKVEALVAVRDANEEVSKLATALVDDRIGKVPAVPGGVNATELTTAVGGVTPDAALRTAVAAFEAANSAAAKWSESANAVKVAVTEALSALSGSHPDTARLNQLNTEADTKVTQALAAQRAIDPDDAGSSISRLNAIASGWTAWINANGHTGVAQAGDIMASSGVATMMTTETKRRSNHVGAQQDELIRVASGIKFAPYPTVASGLPSGTNIVEPCNIALPPPPPPPPGAVGAAPPPPAPEAATIRKNHICGRHVREAFKFGHVDGGPNPDDVTAGHMIAAAYEGVPPWPGEGTGNLPPPGTKLRSLRKQAKAQKVNSFLPEEVNVGNVTQVVEKALSAVRANYADTAAFHTAIATAAQPGFLKDTVSVDIPPPADIHIGIKLAGTPAVPKADMVHGTKVTMTMPDMMAIGRAIGQ
ncbi:hypothetical protein ACERZ8_20205 [Tateyamaria armeniaca]|uniref:Uncharacterized protein n=1 Tax=Tateyamaria armeniaca TaxID=2518930 RepID=A0ABW8UZ29_9RHOB